MPNSNPGHWQPLLPNGTSPLDPTPWVGGAQSFLLETSSQFRTAGPNALTSAAYTADFNEVKALGGDGVVTATARTADQTHNAIFWQSTGGPALMWNGVARNLTEDPAHALDNADNARLLAMMNLSGADAAINCWNDKYHFDFLAAVAGDPTRGPGRQPCNGARHDLDAAPDGAVSRARVRAHVPRRCTSPRAPSVLRHGRHAFRRHE